MTAEERIAEAVALAALSSERQLLCAAEYLEASALRMSHYGPPTLPLVSPFAAVAVLCRVLAQETRCNGCVGQFCDDCCPF